MEFDNIFAHDMVIRRPIFFKFFPIVHVADSRTIIKQFVEPDVNSLLRIPGQRQRKFGRASRYRDVFQAMFDKRYDFIAAGYPAVTTFSTLLFFPSTLSFNLK